MPTIPTDAEKRRRLPWSLAHGAVILQHCATTLAERGAECGAERGAERRENLILVLLALHACFSEKRN